MISKKQEDGNLRRNSNRKIHERKGKAPIKDKEYNKKESWGGTEKRTSKGPKE